MLVAMYSTSTKPRVTNFYFLLNQDTSLDPKLRQQPKVLHLSIVLPTQSISVKPISLIPSH